MPSLRDLAARPSLELRLEGSGCTGATLFAQVDGSRAREWVPAAFAPFLNASGSAVLMVQVVSFERLQIDDVRLASVIASEVTLRIHARHEGGESHRYVLSHATNDRHLCHRLRTVGIRSELCNWLTVQDRRLRGPERSLVATVPLRGSGYGISARIAEVGAVSASETAVLWHEGGLGLVSVTATWKISAVALALGELLTNPAHELAHLIGGKAAAVSGWYGRFDIAATGARPVARTSGSRHEGRTLA